MGVGKKVTLLMGKHFWQDKGLFLVLTLVKQKILGYVTMNA